MKKEQQILINRINELCKKKGYSYYTLSYKSDVPLSTLMHILDGSSKSPGLFTILKICAGLDLTLAKFFDTKEFESLIKE